MTTWFTSDWHIGHKNIIEYSQRPFRDVSEMTEAIVANFNAVVEPEDVVYHLGDFALGIKHVAPTLARLVKCKHLLVPGNRDDCHSCHRRGRDFIAKYLGAGFDLVLPERLVLQLPNSPSWESALDSPTRHMCAQLTVNVCHMPYRGDSRATERYPEHRPGDDGRWLLHGHVHEKWKVRDRQINIGVDQWGFTPVSAETLMKLIVETASSPEEVQAKT